MKLPAVERRRPTPLDGLLVLLVVAFAIALILLLRPSPGTGVTATVVVNGETIAQYRLDQLADPVTLTLDKVPYPLSIRVESGRICIEHSSCPSQDCVRTGWISKSGQKIICLPNRLVISLSGSEAGDFDAVTG